ncbi:MAG: DegT/DnrJ/EryC1/StrS family aminotransferase [Flavobacteriaceae bacterium]
MSKNNKIWLSSPHMGGEEQKYISKALQDNWVSSVGPNITGFENVLEKYLEENRSVAVTNTGTSALHLALILAGVSSNDEVLCQTFTFIASVNPVLYQGAIPIFIDSEFETWNMCPIKLEEAILDRLSNGTKPKAIIVVHLYGMPAQIDKIQSIAKKYDITLIEDAAEALGSSYKGQKCGTFGDYGILSFNGNKIITTSGGGALICNDQETKGKAIFLATQAKDNKHYYEHSKLGYNYRMSNISAGIGRGQMEVLEKRIQSRIDIHSFYEEVFEELNGVKVFKISNCDYVSNYWLTCILIDEGIAGFSNEELRLQFMTDNIESRLLWKPMHLQPLFCKEEYYGNNTSEVLFKKGLCLPSGSNMTNIEKKRIKASLYKVLR